VTPQIKLTAARNAGEPVRVTLEDGRVLTGVPEVGLTGLHKIQHHGAARPSLFLPEDVVDVRPAE
jgi:hypothetical protein